MHSKAGYVRLAVILCGVAIAIPNLQAQARRLVMIKVDGLPANLIERRLSEIDPATGNTRLPWIHRVFVEGGAWMRNFYVRGISLSAPSWQMLDTGHKLLIHGNAEYDRFTGHVYDYLNFFPSTWATRGRRWWTCPASRSWTRVAPRC